MLSWTELARYDSAVVAQAQAVASAVRAARVARFGEEPGTEGREYLMERVAPVELPEPFPELGSIHGVGVLFDEPGNVPVPAVFADYHTEPWTTVTDTTIQVQIANGAAVPFGRLVFVSLPRPEAALGERAQLLGPPLRTGTIGARVQTTGGVSGFLLAGHVAGSVGSAVQDDDGRLIGIVKESMSPNEVGPCVVAADVAYVEVANGAVNPGASSSGRIVPILPRDDLEMIGAKSGQQVSWVRGIATSWIGEFEAHGDWGYVYITSSRISQDGDSGAPVYKQHTNDLVGHLVGGGPGYSIVQEIDYQLGHQQSQTQRSGLVNVILG